MNYIYALICPISNQIRYVGKTNSVRVRYNAHLNDKSKSHKSSWIKSLKIQGLKPKCIILDEVENDVSYWEQYWISQCKCWGFDLVNHTLGGENGCVGIYNPRGNAKLTKEIVIEIYQSIDNIDTLIAKYNVSKSTIRGIKNGSIWSIYTNHKKQPKKHQKLTDEIKQHIKNIRLNGERICNIQKLYPDIPKSTIQSFIEKYCDTGQSDDEINVYK